MNNTLLNCILALLLAVSPALAGVRRFTNVYEATPAAPGSLELENWFTWKRISDPGDTEVLQFRHELEFGVTDRLRVDLYFADWEYQRTDHESGTIFGDVALAMIYNLLNPADKPIGLSFYQEYAVGY